MTTPIYDAERRDISIAVGGDAMITRRMRAFEEPRFLKLVEVLRAADVSLVNLEMLFHDYESSWQWSSATYTRSDPRNLDELKWMGINAVTTANNHSFDFSEGGFLTTLEHCQEIRPGPCRRRPQPGRGPCAHLRGLGPGSGGSDERHQHLQRALPGPAPAAPISPVARGSTPCATTSPTTCSRTCSTPCNGPTWSWGTRRSTPSMRHFGFRGNQDAAGRQHRNRFPGAQVHR